MRGSRRLGWASRSLQSPSSTSTSPCWRSEPTTIEPFGWHSTTQRSGSPGCARTSSTTGSSLWISSPARSELDQAHATRQRPLKAGSTVIRPRQSTTAFWPRWSRCSARRKHTLHRSSSASSTKAPPSSCASRTPSSSCSPKTLTSARRSRRRDTAAAIASPLCAGCTARLAPSLRAVASPWLACPTAARRSTSGSSRCMPRARTAAGWSSWTRGASQPSSGIACKGKD
mmetsp:Transcript_4341/g.12534  ORF Transcript_4341/g.12534 Transcript_4341/m.12534 type:complete len:229 (+) Transcript_4341:419-1105(+)